VSSDKCGHFVGEMSRELGEHLEHSHVALVAAAEGDPVVQQTPHHLQFAAEGGLVERGAAGGQSTHWEPSFQKCQHHRSKHTNCHFY